MDKCQCGGSYEEPFYGGTIGMKLATYRICKKCKGWNKVSDGDTTHDPR